MYLYDKKIKREGGCCVINLHEKVVVRWNNANKKHYIEKGYEFTHIKDEFRVEIGDLPRYTSIKVPVACDICGETYYPMYKNYMKCAFNNPVDCCSKCSPKKLKKTMLERYGVEHYQQTEECKERKRKTCVERYGVENVSQIASVQQKKIETNLSKFGAEWYTQSDSFKDFCIKEYDEDNPMKNRDIQEAATKTLLKNGNVPVSSEEIRFVNILKNIYGEDKCQPSYQEGKLVFDCLLSVNGIKIDVEYDGIYWHKSRAVTDRRRDEVLKRLGYKVLRVLSNGKMPKINDITNAVSYLSRDGKNFARIIV